MGSLTCAYTIPLFRGTFCGGKIMVSGNVDCISRLLRPKKLVLSPHWKWCSGFPAMAPETSLDDALGVHHCACDRLDLNSMREFKFYRKN